MFRNILHKIKIFFCDDDVEKIYVRDSTVIRNNEIHRMYNEILDELGDLATVVSRNYVYGRIKDRTGLSIRHISRIINHSCKFHILLHFRRFNVAGNPAALRPYSRINSYGLYVYRGVEIPVDLHAAIFADKCSIR